MLTIYFYIAIFNKFIKNRNQIVFCKLHQILVLHLTVYICGDFHVVLLFYYLITNCQSPILYTWIYIAIFNKFIKNANQIVFCKLHQIIVLHLTVYHCGDFFVVLLFYYLIINCQSPILYAIYCSNSVSNGVHLFPFRLTNPFFCNIM